MGLSRPVAGKLYLFTLKITVNRFCKNLNSTKGQGITSIEAAIVLDKEEKTHS
jgi:hypothetical protein